MDLYRAIVLHSHRWKGIREGRSMLEPICDSSRLLLGALAALGGIIFASMTGVLKDDIKNLVRRFFQPANWKESDMVPLTRRQRISKFFGWILLVLGFSATVFLGSYAAAVPSRTCVDIVISALVCNPPGDDIDGEYVTLQNLSGKKIDLTGWTLCDYQNNHCYEFGDFTLQPNSSVTLWTKAGMNTNTDLYFGKSQPIWNNKEDTAYLHDIKDQLIYQLPCSKGNVSPPPTPTLPPDYDDLDCIPRDAPRETGQVVDVIDGRTIEVERNDGLIVRVQYLGIATIVKGQPLYKRSVEINRELVLGKIVTLVADPKVTGEDALLLRYVFVEDTFVNHALVSSGYAAPDGDCSCIDDFINMYMAACERDSGFCGSGVEVYGNPFSDTPPPGFFKDDEDVDNKVVIVDIFYNGEKGPQEPDEYVEIKNEGAVTIQLEGWSLSDKSGHEFIFPQYLMEPGRICRIYTNEYHPEWCGFSYESSQAIWGNGQDCATLRDMDGQIVAQSCYE
ncbi:MAG: hypothetical protein C3F07_03525 [Anaerolineales bacterium]|nr:MAG: hypothetical protein C3F07_03525 [Anaerolineales bacterium]